MAVLVKDLVSAEMVFPAASSVPAQYRLTPVVQKDYLINGQLQGPRERVLGPVCFKDGGLQQQVVGEYPLLTAKEALDALRAAASAYGNGQGFWPLLSVAERIGYMQRFVIRMKAQRDRVVQLLMWEIGKSLKASQGEFDRTVQYIQDTIDSLKDLDRTSSRFTISEGVVAQIRRAPLGVVLCMGPYNYPLNETFTTLIPAILMGNTVIFKPPRMGVLLHSPLLEAFRDCFPPGVVNTVYGEGPTIITPIMASGDTSVLAFIGSSRVADVLKKQHPKPHRLRCVLGLDAKNAGIVLADADLELAVQESVLGALSFNGQRCTALKILWVHRSIYERFVSMFCSRVDGLKAGMPWDNPDLTPLPDVSVAARMTRIVTDAVSKGARIANARGGSCAATFFHPAVLVDVKPNMDIWTEEQFGPITPIVPFDNVAEPIRFIDDSNYGQQVAVFGRDPAVIGSLVDSLVNQVCRVNINSQCQRGPDTFPFTGRKDSAEGTLSVSDALRVFSLRTLVASKMTEDNNRLITDIVQSRKSKFISTDFIL
eukprot:m51a1_g13734 putative aldehyde dehydrogenase (540) ;mRNA; f:149931-151924